MITYLSQRRESWPFKLMSAVSSLTFLFTLILPPSVASAQQMSILNLPGPGSMVLPTAGFAPALMKGLKVHPENPLAFDFIIDTGDSKLTGAALDQETSKLVRYFLATLTTPEENLWVNLSPYEKDRIIPDKFGETEMGRDLLAQDYILKQLMASMMYPEDGLGKEFWKRVYDRAQKEFGTTNIPINTFNKIWIVPETANVVEYQGSAFVTNSHLKVMLEEDYLALAKNMDNKDFGIKGTPEPQVKDASAISSKVIKEVLIPEIEKEVNQGKNFAQLRQVYHSMILATWYKQALKESLLAKVYVDKSKIKGVDVDDKEIKQKIYAQYVEAFKKGVYNYIKKDIDPATQKAIPRKYFSGGFSAEKMNLGRRTLASPAALRAELGKIGVSSPTNSTIVSSAVQLTENPQEGDAVKQVADMRAERKAVITALDKVREDLGQRNSLFLNQPLPGQLNTVFYEKGAVSFVIHAMDEAQAEAVQITRRQDGQGIIFDVTVQNSRGTWQDLKNSVDKEVRKLTDEGRLEDPREIGVIISNLLYWWGQGGQAELKGTSTTPGDRAIRIKENLQMLLAEGAMDTWISRGEELVRKDWEELNGLSADSIPLSQSAQLIQVLLKMQEKAEKKGIILSSPANILKTQKLPAGFSTTAQANRFFEHVAGYRNMLFKALNNLIKGQDKAEVEAIQSLNWLGNPENARRISNNSQQAQQLIDQIKNFQNDHPAILNNHPDLGVAFAAVLDAMASSSPAGVLEPYASWANEFLQELQAKTAQGVLQETTSLREFWTEGNQATIRIPQVVYNEQRVQVVYKGSGNISIMPVGEKTPLVEFKAPPAMTVKELMNELKSWTLETSIPSSSPTEKVPLEEVWGKKIVVADPDQGIRDAVILLLKDKGLLPENVVFVSTLSGATNAIEENIKANKEVVLVIASELLADIVDEKKIRGAGYQGTIVVLDRSRKNETLLRLNSMGVADYDVVQKFSMNEELFPDIRDVEFSVPVLPNNQDNDVFSSPSETGKKRVLVVDDEASIRDLLKEVLESWGYEVVLAIDGRDAVDKMGQGFDAVLTDNNMPNMDGIDFLRALRGQGNNVPVILTTGMASQELENETQKLGADFLEKPVGLTTLKMAVQKAIPSSPSVNDQDVGGINLDPSLLNLQIKRDKNWVPLPMSEQPPVESMNIDGFYPVIINTTPLPSLPMFLGMIGETPNTDGKTSGPEQLSWLGLSPFDQKARLEKEEIYS